MYTLQVEVSDEIYSTLQAIAHENAIDLPTLLYMQAEQLARSYRQLGITQDLQVHLSESIKRHHTLLQRLAE